MKNEIKQAALGVVLIFSIFSVAGCVPLVVGAAAGAGGISFVKGKMVKNFDHSLTSVHKASTKALKDLGVLIRDDDVTKHEAEIKAEFDDTKKVTITIEALTERASKITVRVGVFGDEDRSRMIMDAISKKL